MTEIVSTVTGKGQVTIPREVRRHLGVAPSDKVVFVIGPDGRVELRPVRFTVGQLRGIVPALPGRETVDFDDQIAEAFADGASRAVQELERR
jgi:AbrB family looped-hinge helix DNA binding protein